MLIFTSSKWNRMWELSAILPDGTPLEALKNEKKVKDAIKCLKGDTTGVQRSIIEACKISRSQFQRNILELLLLSDDCKTTEIPKITGIRLATVRDFSFLFFRVNHAFSSRLDKLDYVESGITKHSSDANGHQFQSFLYKRWAMNLGKDFIIWRFKLEPVDYTPGILYSSIVREAYFYHKEKSMGKDSIEISEYLRSTKTVLDSIKNSLVIKDSSKEDDTYDMQKELGIIIKDTEAFDVTLEEFSADNFINNT